MRFVSRAAVAAILALSCSPLHADTLFGVYAGVGTWDQEYSGDVRSGASRVDVENDLAIADDDNIVLYFALEHGVPVLPNIRAQHFAIDVSGDNVLSRSIEFNGQTFTLADAVA